MNLEEQILTAAAESRATDIHVDPLTRGYAVRFRIDGKLKTFQELDRGPGMTLINQFKASVGIDPGTSFVPRGERMRMEIASHPLDLRVTLVPCISGPKMAIRLLDQRNVVKVIPHLGLQPAEREKLENWARTLNGMILVTGPTSSGKTTTLYSLLHEIAEESRHVVTIEDPVEYEIDGINQIQVDQKHHLDFAEGVKAALRLDPDCLMVGEIRSHDAAAEAVNAAIQGHIVMATMHSRDATSAVTRLRNFDVENHQIATALGVVVNQRLIRKLCGSCKEERPLADSERDFFERNSLTAPASVFHPKGCDRCQGSGYFGRTGVFEIWNLSSADYEMILADADEQSLRDKLRTENHRFIVQDAARKIHDGVTSMEEVKLLGLDLPWTNR